MNKRGVTDIKVYIISIILFTFIIVGGMSLMGIFHNANPDFVQDQVKYEQFNRTFNQYDSVADRVDSIQNSFDTNPDIGLFGYLNALIGTAWNTLKLTFSSFSFMINVFFGMNTIFGVPVWIPALMIMIITIIIAFAMYKAIFQVS